MTNTSSAINTFHFHSDATQDIRVIFVNNDPWFVAKDVALALGYSSNNMGTVFNAVPAEWKGRNRIATLKGEQELLCISEQGLYFFLGRSDKPKALPFQKWYAGEVIPSIRKTGSYTMQNAMPAITDKDPNEIPLNLSYVKQIELLAAKYKMTQKDVLVLSNIRTKARRQGYGMAMSRFEKEFKIKLFELEDKTRSNSFDICELRAMVSA